MKQARFLTKLKAF